MTQLLWVDWYLAGFYSLVAVFYAILVRHKQAESGGHKMVHMGSRYTLHWWNHLTFRVFRISIWTVCVSRLVWPEIDSFLLPISTLQHDSLQLAGAFALTGGFGLAVASNMALNGSWRSGIDDQESSVANKRYQPHLITRGLYYYSRNPAYIGVRTAQVGFFLALPCVFSLVCLVVGWVAISIQVNLEESQLTRQYGETYQHYADSVKRWWGRSVKV